MSATATTAPVSALSGECSGLAGLGSGGCACQPPTSDAAVVADFAEMASCHVGGCAHFVVRPCLLVASLLIDGAGMQSSLVPEVCAEIVGVQVASRELAAPAAVAAAAAEDSAAFHAQPFVQSCGCEVPPVQGALSAKAPA